MAWTASALAAAWVYPFFFVHLFIWLVVLWSVHAYEKFRRTTIICSVIGILCVIPAAVFLYPWLLKPEFQLAFEVQRRLGLSFTRLPVVSNSLLLVIAWTGLVVFLTYIFRKRPEAKGRFYALSVGWITLLCAWLSNVFTDVYIHNDHFRAPAVLLSWLSLSVVWSVVIAVRKAEAGEDVLWQRWPRSVFRISFVFFIGCVAMLAVYIFGKTYVFHGDYLNVVHVSHWITIVAAFVILWSGMSLKHQGSLTATAWSLMFMAALLGVSARGYIFFTEASLFSYYRSYVPVTDWIRKHLPSEDGICADPQHGEALGSFSGRFIYPTYLIEFLPKPDEEVINDIRIEMGHYDVQSAIARDVYIQIFDSMDTTCSQFSVWSRLFVLFGWSRDGFDEISGCPRAEMSALQERLGKYASAHLPNDARFRELCPAVVIASDQVDFWSLPEDYRETVIDEAFSVWRTSNDE
jgi:hypothetical protein